MYDLKYINKIKIFLYFNTDYFKKTIYKNNNFYSYRDLFIDMVKPYQKGGNVNIKYNNNNFTFENIYDNVYILSAIDRDDECISITIDIEEKIAIINNINADTLKCGESIMTNQGSHLLQIAIKFIKKIKDKYNIKKIELKDNAYINCFDKRIELSNMLLFTKGYTFYSKYGFTPKDSNIKSRLNKILLLINKLKVKHINFKKIYDLTKNDNDFYKIKEDFKNILNNIDKYSEYKLVDYNKNIFNKKNCLLFLIISNIYIYYILTKFYNYIDFDKDYYEKNPISELNKFNFTNCIYELYL